MGLLDGKRALVLGIANDKSIGWGVAQALKREGAEVALTCQNEALEKRVLPLSQELGAIFVSKFDASKEDDYKSLKESVVRHWGQFDILVHSLAFAQSDDLKKRFCEISREGFILACDISAFSFVRLCGELKDLMREGSSAMAMTYLGSQKVAANYSLMGVAKAALESAARYLADDLGPAGIRVNCISSGPIRTLAASAISGTRQMIKESRDKTPIRQSIAIEDVGNSAVYLASNLSSKVTGQIIYVDAGYSILGV